jgi:DNA-binding MarR family transcriptional regulator
MPEIYLRFLNLLKALDEPIFEDKNNGCLQLLQKICIESFLTNKSSTVNEVISWKLLGSQASLHKRLHELVELGLITLDPHPTDGRIKIVTPTSKAKKLFKQLDKMMATTTTTTTTLNISNLSISKK